jgi:hypothetical protein
MLCQLVRSVGPKVIVAHGKEASSLVQGIPCCEGVRTKPVGLDPADQEIFESAHDEPQEDGTLEVTVIETPHFRRVSESEAVSVGEQAAQIAGC